MFSCTKRFSDFPFAHRQPNHEGHCSLIHGHNWAFEFEFVCDFRDHNGFVIDFGDLKWLREWLKHRFDHTLVINNNDPYVDQLCGLDSIHLAKTILVPNCGAEGLAEYLYEQVNRQLQEITDGRVSLIRVTVFEDSRNSATYVE